FTGCNSYVAKARCFIAAENLAIVSRQSCSAREDILELGAQSPRVCPKLRTTAWRWRKDCHAEKRSATEPNPAEVRKWERCCRAGRLHPAPGSPTRSLGNTQSTRCTGWHASVRGAPGTLCSGGSHAR